MAHFERLEFGPEGARVGHYGLQEVSSIGGGSFDHKADRSLGIPSWRSPV